MVNAVSIVVCIEWFVDQLVHEVIEATDFTESNVATLYTRLIFRDTTHTSNCSPGCLHSTPNYQDLLFILYS